MPHRFQFKLSEELHDPNSVKRSCLILRQARRQYGHRYRPTQLCTLASEKLVIGIIRPCHRLRYPPTSTCKAEQYIEFVWQKPLLTGSGERIHHRFEVRAHRRYPGLDHAPSSQAYNKMIGQSLTRGQWDFRTMSSNAISTCSETNCSKATQPSGRVAAASTPRCSTSGRAAPRRRRRS